MSKEYPELLPVTQADREAAALLAEWLTDAQKEWEGMVIWFVADAPRAFRDGAFDNHEFVQAFARHRISGQEEVRAEIERLREALAEIASPLDGIPVGDPWAFYADLQQFARAALHSPEDKDNG